MYFLNILGFLLPNEAFDYTHNLESKYNSEKIIPLTFEPRIFDEAHFKRESQQPGIWRSEDRLGTNFFGFSIQK
jgi:hypothetical protein